MPDRLTSLFWSGDVIRSRRVSDVVHCGVVDVPVPAARLVADWERDIASRLMLEPGDVEPLPLARARTRWPDYTHCVQAMRGWTRTLGMTDEVLAAADIALMACRGARYHHDGAQYGDAAFCNLFISDDKGLDVHFPSTGHRIPLVRGTVLMFDTGQPHAVVRRGAGGFDAADFAAGSDCSQMFLTWELPIEHPDIARALRIDIGADFDIDIDIYTSSASQPGEAQVLCNGARASVCPASGRWIHDDVVGPRSAPA